MVRRQASPSWRGWYYRHEKRTNDRTHSWALADCVDSVGPSVAAPRRCSSPAQHSPALQEDVARAGHARRSQDAQLHQGPRGGRGERGGAGGGAGAQRRPTPGRRVRGGAFDASSAPHAGCSRARLQSWSEPSKAMAQVVGSLARSEQYLGVDFARVDLEACPVRCRGRRCPARRSDLARALRRWAPSLRFSLRRRSTCIVPELCWRD